MEKYYGSAFAALLLFKWGLGGTDGLVELSNNVTLADAKFPGLMESREDAGMGYCYE